MVVICGGGGFGGLLLLRPELVAGIPGLEGLLGPSSSGTTLEQAIQTRIDSLTTEGIVRCQLHSKVSLDLTVTPAGAIVPGAIRGVPAPQKAHCLETHLKRHTIKPAPAKSLTLSVDVPGG